MEDKQPNTSYFNFVCVSTMTSPCSLNRSMTCLQNWQDGRQQSIK